MRKGKFYDLSDYNITENGEIINLHNGHIVKPQLNSKGYLRVHIGHKMEFVHRLVAEKFVSNPYNKPQVNHIDGNKLNNSASNLEWVTNQENRDHAVKNNLIIKGEKCPWAKLTQDNVNYIKNHLSDIDHNILAKQFGVNITTIKDILHKRNWKD